MAFDSRLGIAALAALALLAGCGERQPPAAPGAPNIVMVMTDDQALGDLAFMPKVQSLVGARGVTFANSFVSWPTCCPSRATAFTGQYAHNHQVLGNYPPKGGFYRFDDRETLPVWLYRAGYRTSHIGKFLNLYGTGRKRGPTYVPAGWTDWFGLVDPGTYGMWGYTINHDGALKTYGRFRDEDPALYQTDVLRDLALDTVSRLAAGQRPFFLSLATLAPHEEIAEFSTEAGAYGGPRPAPRHRGALNGIDLPTTPDFAETDLSDKPKLITDLRDSGRYLVETRQARRSRYQRRLESLRAVDEAVEALVLRLDQLHLLERTYLIFTSDNGFFNGEHGIPLGKFLMYEPSIRVPLLMRGPGIPAGGASQELVANVDLAATIVEAASAKPGRVLDGRSLIGFARDPQRRSGRPVLLDAPNEQVQVMAHVKREDALVVPALMGLRTPHLTYVEWGTGETELYDLRSDPYELQSRHADPKYRGVIDALHAALQRYRDCAGDACRAELPEPALP